MKASNILIKIEELREYKGGDYGTIPILSKNIDEAILFIKELDKLDIAMPDVFPYSGGTGLQMEWETKKIYLEIDFDYPVNDTIYSAYIHIKGVGIDTSMSFEHRKDAANFVKFISTQYKLKRKSKKVRDEL